jgi:D-alanine-D-alanine ligase
VRSHSGKVSAIRLKIVVLTGGVSQERDVAIASAARVVPALRSRGHSVTGVDTRVGPIQSQDEGRFLDRRVAALSASPIDQPVELGESKVASGLDSDQLRRWDVVMLALPGVSGKNGKIQALPDIVGTRYTGSGVLDSGDNYAGDVEEIVVDNVPMVDSLRRMAVTK